MCSMDGVNTAKPAGEYNLVSDCSTEFIILNVTYNEGRWVGVEVGSKRRYGASAQEGFMGSVCNNNPHQLYLSSGMKLYV